jgi:hypothetical protein
MGKADGLSVNKTAVGDMTLLVADWLVRLDANVFFIQASPASGETQKMLTGIGGNLGFCCSGWPPQFPSCQRRELITLKSVTYKQILVFAVPRFLGVYNWRKYV